MNSRASCSSRPDSAASTSMASGCSAVAGARRAARRRAGWASADCASHGRPGAPSRERPGAARPRSRAPGRAPGRWPSPAVRCASAANSGAPRRGRSGGSGSQPADVPVQPISSSIGPAELAGEMAAESDRRVQESRADQEYRERQAGIVVATERLGSLKPSDGGVERGGVVVEGLGARPASAGSYRGFRAARGRWRRPLRVPGAGPSAGDVERIVHPQPRIASAVGTAPRQIRMRRIR